MTTYRKKLIEVALPLDAINVAAAREKSIRHGHPSTLHLWWARRPLAAARAVLFGQLVDDPSSWPTLWPTDADQERERERLFEIIRTMVPWEASNKPGIIYSARYEIARSHARTEASERAKELLGLVPEGTTFTDEKTFREARFLIDEYLANELPPVHDPFAGGGTIPLEAQRLGLRAIASDLNPVAVLISKALVEIPSRFAGCPAVNPESRTKGALRSWQRAEGLADDVRYYGRWMREEAWRRVGHLYPQVELPGEQGGGSGTAIAWVWARTVASPNPAFPGAHVPLVSSFWLSKKEGKETWVEPVVTGDSYTFEIRTGKPDNIGLIDIGTKLGRGANFRCVLSGVAIQPDYIKAEGASKRMGARLMAVVAEGRRGRIYLRPDEGCEPIATPAKPAWVPDQDLPQNPRWFSPPDYGMPTYADLFTARQLVTLTTFADLVIEARERVLSDARDANKSDAGARVLDDGSTLEAYSDSVATYLAFVLDKLAETSSTICTWSPAPKNELVVSTFRRQALPMTWDFAESNPFADSSGSVDKIVSYVAKALDAVPAGAHGRASQQDAAAQDGGGLRIISTDPPYYDNIGYADLSDFFYVWLRRSLRGVFPDLLATMLVPKMAELVATPYRHGGKDEAERFFLAGMTRALDSLVRSSDPSYPAAIYYAFRQSESDAGGGISSTGWETFLAAVLESGFSVDGTWPVRTERGGRSNDIGANALASSVVLVCRSRSADAVATSRADFRRLLRTELPAALKALQHGHIAPVDLAQASIGPGMAIFSRHSKVLEPDGSAMTVRTALQLINEALDEYLSAQEGDLDADTRFGVTWLETYGFDPAAYGMAETLAKARNVSVQGVEQAGIIKQIAGKVRLLRRAEMPDDWAPGQDGRPTVWEATQHLIKRLESAGELRAALLMSDLGSTADQARDLAYRLYSVCERKGWSEEALAYNSLVVAWPELQKLASNSAGLSGPVAPAQASLALGDEPLFKNRRGRRKLGADDPQAVSPTASPRLQTSLGLGDEPLFRKGASRKTKAVPTPAGQEPDAK